MIIAERNCTVNEKIAHLLYKTTIIKQTALSCQEYLIGKVQTVIFASLHARIVQGLVVFSIGIYRQMLYNKCRQIIVEILYACWLFCGIHPVSLS